MSAEPLIPKPRIVPRTRAVARDSVRVGAPCGQPRVDVRSGPDGRVLSLLVTCGCGETTQILCQYGDVPPEGSA